MKILVLTKNLPYPLDQGANIRNYYLLKHLAEEHEIYLLCIARSKKEVSLTGELLQFCKQVECVYLPRSAAAVAKDLLAGLFSPLPHTVIANTNEKLKQLAEKTINTCGIDLIQVEELYLAANILQIPERCAFVLDAHNSEPLILERMAQIAVNPLKRFFYSRQKARMARFEEQAARKAALIFAVSAEEQAYFQRFNKRVFVVPNGIEEVARKAAPAANRLLFTGLLSYPPNRDSLLFFLQQIWPVVRAKDSSVCFDIVGRSPDQKLLSYADERTFFHPAVDDIAPYFAQAKILVAPLRAGGGTRFKILQAFAEGIAVVSTAIGAEGLAANNNTHLLVRDEPDSFAEAVLQLCSSDALVKEITANAAAFVEENYLWSSIVKNCLTAYQMIGN